MKKLLAIFISIALLSTGWLGWSGLTLLVALTPLLWISAEAEDSRRGWWQTFAYALLCFVGWNLSTIWWIGYSTPVGPVAATFASSLLSMIAFMVFHTISKKASKALSYTILISLWITLEYAYTTSDFSWPWLLLGNGLSNDVWAVQWYEFTGLFGGSLWILLTNILLFEGVYKSTKLLTIIPGLALAITPLILSTIMFITYQEPNKGEVRVSVIQPNIDCYDKFNGSEKTQQELLARLAGEAPKDSQFIVMPETAIPGHFFETQINNYKYIQRLRDSIAHRDINNMLITGANTIIRYQSADESPTARSYGENYIDIFNSAITITPYKRMVGIHHKAKLVIGVEQTPTWIFKLFKFFVIDLGGVVGQIGRGEEATVFEHDGVKFGTAVCYEGLYGGYYGGFARGGAEFMTIISNDGWWRDTPGHRHLFSMSALRAIESRRAIARSANTGISGFISSRGEIIDSLGWGKQGVLTNTIKLNDKLTIYTRYGDYIARLAQFICAIALLYYLAFRVKQRNYLD